MLRSKGMISPPLHIPRVFKDRKSLLLRVLHTLPCTSDHAFFLPSEPLPFITFLSSTWSMLTPSHQSLFWHLHSLSCHCSPLCSLCSHSSVQHLQDTGFVHAAGKAVLGHLTKEQLSTQLAAHRPAQGCGYNPNVSYKLGLTATKILALKKLHKETCTAHLRSFYGVWGKKPGNQQSAHRWKCFASNYY